MALFLIVWVGLTLSHYQTDRLILAGATLPEFAYLIPHHYQTTLISHFLWYGSGLTVEFLQAKQQFKAGYDAI